MYFIFSNTPLNLSNMDAPSKSSERHPRFTFGWILKHSSGAMLVILIIGILTWAHHFNDDSHITFEIHVGNNTCPLEQGEGIIPQQYHFNTYEAKLNSTFYDKCGTVIFELWLINRTSGKIELSAPYWFSESRESFTEYRAARAPFSAQRTSYDLHAWGPRMTHFNLTLEWLREHNICKPWPKNPSYTEIAWRLVSSDCKTTENFDDQINTVDISLTFDKEDQARDWPPLCPRNCSTLSVSSY